MNWDIRQNPYNFVRFSERIVEKDERGNPLPLPDHSVFTGNTGYLECELTNETPLFCGGKASEDSHGHKTIDFFRLNGEMAIPSTALKGMIRSFIETLTGSCLTVIDREVLSYRKMLRPAETKCGRVIELANQNNPGRIEEMRKIRVPIREVVNSRDGSPIRFDILERRPPVARVTPTGKYTGILKKTEKNFGRKRYERIYYNPTGKRFSFSIEEQTIYNRIINTQIENWKRMKIQEGVTETNFHRLSTDDLIIFQISGENAHNLAYIEVPRLSYKNSIGALLGKDIPPDYCSEEDRCQACRLFGYVKDKDACAGKISFSHGIICQAPALSQITIKPLGKPNPTSVNLYLSDTANPNVVRDYNNARIEPRGDSFAPSRTDIGGNVHLRGRKFYWHGRDNILENARSNEKQKFNSTIEVVKSPATFSFRVYFSNLTDFELGLLLYGLKLEGNMRHKLGMGKNLGFGTVKIEVKKLFIDNLNRKYDTFNSDYQEDRTADIDTKIDNFRNKCSQLAGKPFDKIPAVEDLKIIMDKTKAPKKVGYEAITEIKDSWYMKNKNQSLPNIQTQIE